MVVKKVPPIALIAMGGTRLCLLALGHFLTWYDLLVHPFSWQTVANTHVIIHGLAIFRNTLW